VTDLVEELVEARRPWVCEVIRSWYADAELTRQLRAAVATEAHRVADLAFGQEFRDKLAVEGPRDPLDWANRRLDLPGGGWAVTGIRFRGADARRPFVDVIGTTQPPTPEGLAVVAEVVLPAYEAFVPLCLRVEVPDPSGLVEKLGGDPRFGAGNEVDMHLVAGLVQQLREHPRAAAYPHLSLRPGDPHELAGTVAAVYAELVAREPELAMWAHPEDAESLAACAAEGLLFEVLVDQAPAGVVAAVRDNAHAMAGFCVRELCLDSTHRGRHVAAAMLQRLIDQLPASATDVLWGTIHPRNTPSLRNALSVGRVPVGGYAWVTPAGLPGMPQTAG
jgi:L-amino acid N-acyltransferase YncA